MGQIFRQKLKLKKINFFLLFILLLAFLLRFWQLGVVPPGLFGDEVDTGYQAYSILKTGRDYFGNLLPIHFQSYGDWRVPLYIYLDSPFVGLFGLNELGVRLPAAILGLLAVLASFFLAKKISQDEKMALVTAFLVAISPWHVHFSRAAFEAIFLTFLFPLAVIFFLQALTSKKNRDFVIAALLFGLTPYAYNTPKLFLPLIILVLLGIYRKELLARKKKSAIFLIVLGLILLPMLVDIFQGPGIARFNSLSIFRDESTPERVRLTREDSSLSPNLQRLFYNKVGFWTQDFIDNYLSSFSTQFLFIRGDPSPRQSIGTQGELYLFELPFLFLGFGLLFYQALKKKKKIARLVLAFIFLTPVPAAITQGGGEHAIRLLSMIPWLQLATAAGFVFAAQNLKKKWRRLFLAGWLAVALFFLVLFIVHYFDLYPKVSGRWWNFGYREVFEYVNQVQEKYDQIYISPSWEPSVVYTLFYSQYPPQKAQQQLTISPDKVDKYWFLSPDVTRLKRGEGDRKTLFVLNPAELEVYGLKLEEESSLRKIKDVFAPDGTEAFVIFSSSDVE
jgi:4-amino-4-deoxy-L-arabinose transferase-like glycosyltransferase